MSDVQKSDWPLYSRVLWEPLRRGRLPKLAEVWCKYAPGGLPDLDLLPENPARHMQIKDTRIAEIDLANGVAKLAETGPITPRAAALKIARRIVNIWRQDDPRWWAQKGRNEADAMRAALHDAIYRAWLKHRPAASNVPGRETA
jgi:hypothetical protein